MLYSDKMLFDMEYFLMQEEVAAVAEKGMLYRPNYCDKYGRPVIVMRPCNKVSSENLFQIPISTLFNLVPENGRMRIGDAFRYTLWLATSLFFIFTSIKHSGILRLYIAVLTLLLSASKLMSRVYGLYM